MHQPGIKNMKTLFFPVFGHCEKQWETSEELFTFIGININKNLVHTILES